jgi:integrase
MTFYNRNGVLYVRINNKRVSTKLQDTPQNRKLVLSYQNNNEFFNKFDLIVKSCPLFIDLCGLYLDKKEPFLKSTSYNSYSSLYYSRIKPYFKNLKVNQITRKDVQRFFSTFTDTSTLNICFTILKGAFEIASIEEYITFIPLVSKPRIKSSDYVVSPFSLKEIDLLLTNCEDLQFKNMLGLAFYSGMRLGEIFGLMWNDINFDDYTISIKRTITNGYTQTPKTKSSLRTIDMLPQSEEFLLSQKRLTGLSSFVFIKQKGNSFKRTCDLRYKWVNLLLVCGLEYRNMYQTRHSFASNMLANNESLNWVAYTMGHKSPKITLDKYSRYINIKRNERKKTFLDDIDTKSAHA